MDVHHHPNLPHGKSKHLKEYFLEFLMIFLAVTMGFIAENIREHVSDNSKEKEYIAGMIKNLEVDTAELKFTIGRTESQYKGIDTLRSISKDKLADLKVQDSLFLYTSNYLLSLNPFKNDDVTLIQLRNAGGYRFLRKQGVLDSIAIYESKINFLNIQLDYYSESMKKSIETVKFIFDLNANARFRKNHFSTPILITTDKDKINNFYNQCWMMSIVVRNYTALLKDQLKFSTRLIAYLKNTYHVD